MMPKVKKRKSYPERYYRPNNIMLKEIQGVIIKPISNCYMEYMDPVTKISFPIETSKLSKNTYEKIAQHIRFVINENIGG